MAFKTDKVVFKKLNKLPLAKRLEVAQSSNGASILGSLTPSELADLFPNYYRRALPDVGGFHAATTAAARERQSEASASLLDRLTKAEKGIEEYATQTYEKIKRKLGFGTKAPPGLTPEQEAAWNKVISGAVDINSSEGKLFGKLTDQQLNGIGITRGKDNTGRDVFQYAQPESSRQEAESRLSKTEQARSIEQVANRLGIPPKDLAAVMHYESAGTMSTSKWGGTGGNYLGLIQFGPQERKDFGVYAGQPFNEQVDAAGKFLEQRGLKRWLESHPNATQEEKRIALYSTINAGSPNESNWHKSDNGGRDNVITHTQRIFSEHYGFAEKFMEREGPKDTQNYSEDQINKMMVQLRDEKNAARKQQLANLLTDAGVNTATINSVSETTSSGVIGEHFGESKECVALSKHFNPNVGPASSWRFHDGEAGIVPGAVIATRSYSDGTGGKRASQMPDGKSHYHTGVALTKPDSDGNVLILDQAVGHGSKITKVNIRGGWNGEKWGAVVNGEPNEGSMKAVNIALERASESEKAVIMQSIQGKEPTVAASTPEVKPVVDGNVPGPVKPTNQEGQPLPPQETAQVTKPTEPPKPQAARYKFDEAAFESAVRSKYGMLSSMYDRAGLVQEFKSKLPEGVTYEKGILTIKDPNSPHIKSIRADMEKEFGKEAIDRMITQVKEEKKVEPKPVPTVQETPKPKQEQKAEAPQQKQEAPPEKKAAAEPPKPSAPEPPKQTAEVQPNPTAPTVPGASDGGSFNVPGQVDFYPMDKRDNLAAVDTKTQQPLFTAKGGERIDITPQQKVNGNMGPSGPDFGQEMNALRQEMSAAISGAGEPPKVNMVQGSSPRSDTPNFIGDLTKQNKNKQYHNPAFERAMNRTRMQETGDPLNNHFSSDNTNY